MERVVPEPILIHIVNYGINLMEWLPKDIGCFLSICKHFNFIKKYIIISNRWVTRTPYFMFKKSITVTYGGEIVTYGYCETEKSKELVLISRYTFNRNGGSEFMRSPNRNKWTRVSGVILRKEFTPNLSISTYCFRTRPIARRNECFTSESVKNHGGKCKIYTLKNRSSSQYKTKSIHQNQNIGNEDIFNLVHNANRGYNSHWYFVEKVFLRDCEQNNAKEWKVFPGFLTELKIATNSTYLPYRIDYDARRRKFALNTIRKTKFKRMTAKQFDKVRAASRIVSTTGRFLGVKTRENSISTKITS
jgi:hypothetical protein